MLSISCNLNSKVGKSWTGPQEREQRSCNQAATHFRIASKSESFESLNPNLQFALFLERNFGKALNDLNDFLDFSNLWKKVCFVLKGESRKGSRASSCQLVGRPRTAICKLFFFAKEFEKSFTTFHLWTSLNQFATLFFHFNLQYFSFSWSMITSCGAICVGDDRQISKDT